MEALAFISILGVIVSLFMLIISAIKRNGKMKKWGIGIVVCFILMIICTVNSDSTNKAETTSTSNTTVSSADKSKADAKAKKDTAEVVQANESQKSTNVNANSGSGMVANVKDSLRNNSGENNLVDNAKDQILNVVDSNNDFVNGVKNAIPEQYPNSTYGDAFNNFFGSPTWKYFVATTGEKVVEFTGFCEYQDTDVKAKLQFIISQDGKTFKIRALDFNSVPQNELTKQSLLTTVFKQRNK